MENILILAYYYAPCRGVAAYRPSSWAKDFQKHNFKTTTITRQWEGNENVWTDYQKELDWDIKIVNENNSKTIYLPYRKNKYLMLSEKKWMRLLGFNKLIHLFLTITGNFQPEVDAYACFKEYLFKHLQNEKYKVIIVTSPPLNILKLAVAVNKEFKIPFIVDFQDSWNNLMLSENYNPCRKEKFYNSMKLWYLQKWLSKVSFIITVTPSIADLIEKVTEKPVRIITNGFEKEKYTTTPVKATNSYFNISLMGTVHPIQDITMMLKGLNLFLNGKDPELVRVNFIGLNSVPESSRKVKAALPDKFVYISDRVSMDESVEMTLAANILLFPCYKGYKDYYTAKIFEYLGAGRNILMVPGNNDIVDDLILRTGTGKIANSEEEFAAILEKWYIEWKSTGSVEYRGLRENIDFYSRENQNDLFCDLIKKM
ncbi:MAG: hypothetical protein K0R26_2679 [Bacteroidota bacterium]|jgi:hypothetical protein|nr:hypothetical protein [Bacteroidota bacterium]